MGTTLVGRWIGRRGELVVSAVLVLFTGACAGSDAAPERSPAAAPEPVPSVSPPGRDDDCTQLTQGVVAEIVAIDNTFAPDCVVVVTDQTIRIRNLGVRDHTFTISPDPRDLAPFLLDIEPIGGGEIEVSAGTLGDALEPGVYNFFCKFHSGMDGEMQVLAPVS